MRVLITGAAGFVGTHLTRYWLNAHPGAEVIALYHHAAPPTSPPALHVLPVACDILEGEGRAVAAVIHRYQPDLLFHLAGYASAAGADREAIFRVNVEGTRYVLQACAALPKPPPALLASTGYVYGNCNPSRPARETDPLDTRTTNPYVQSKIHAEAVAHQYAAFCRIARSFNHTGPGQSPDFAIPAFARQIALAERGEAPPVLRVGNLQAARDFLDVRDVVRAYRLILEHGAPGETYNVCSGTAHTMRELLDRLRALATVPTEVIADPARWRPNDISVSVGDPSRLKALGWAPGYTLEETLLATLDYWRRSHHPSADQ